MGKKKLIQKSSGVLGGMPWLALIFLTGCTTPNYSSSAPPNQPSNRFPVASASASATTPQQPVPPTVSVPNPKKEVKRVIPKRIADVPAEAWIVSKAERTNEEWKALKETWTKENPSLADAIEGLVQQTKFAIPKKSFVSAMSRDGAFVYYDECTLTDCLHDEVSPSKYMKQELATMKTTVEFSLDLKPCRAFQTNYQRFEKCAKNLEKKYWQKIEQHQKKFPMPKGLTAHYGQVAFAAEQDTTLIVLKEPLKNYMLHTVNNETKMSLMLLDPKGIPVLQIAEIQPETEKDTTANGTYERKYVALFLRDVWMISKHTMLIACVISTHAHDRDFHPRYFQVKLPEQVINR
jgi:hypothetical protein